MCVQQNVNIVIFLLVVTCSQPVNAISGLQVGIVLNLNYCRQNSSATAYSFMPQISQNSVIYRRLYRVFNASIKYPVACKKKGASTGSLYGGGNPNKIFMLKSNFMWATKDIQSRGFKRVGPGYLLVSARHCKYALCNLSFVCLYVQEVLNT